MSSKKQLRKRRQEEEKASPRSKVNPAVLFIAGIAVVVLGLVVGVAVSGGESGPGEPPFPGAVWSPAHGHWH